MTRKVKSVQTLFKIIDLLHENESAGVTEIADKLGYTKGAVHKHLKTMEDYGYVRQKDREYCLDFAFLTYGGFVRNRTPICQAAEREMSMLRSEIDHVISFATQNNEYSLYTHVENDTFQLRDFVPVGSRMYLHQTAAGKAILSTYSETEIEGFLEQELPKVTENTIDNLDDLHREIDVVRHRGFAISNEESLPGVISIAASTEGDSTTGAISISLPSKDRNPDDVEARFGKKIIDAASRIELRLRYSVNEI